MAKGRYRADPDDRGHRPRKPRSPYKNTKRWCRGKEGVEHVPRLVLSNDALTHGWTCGPAPSWMRIAGWKWRCHHLRQCANCGKILRHFLSEDECPAAEQEQQGQEGPS